MTASALRPKTNMRRLLYFLGISLGIHLVMLVVFSIDYLFGAKPKPPAEGAAPAAAVAPASAPTAASAAAATAPAAAAAPAHAPTSEKPAAIPAAPAKPKDADAEYQRRQKPLSEGEKKKAESIRPDLDQLK
jgi:hypothetical protein